MADYDADDIHFLALAISLNAHGIITKDKHFEKQREIKIWKLGECGRISSTVSHGAFSLFILDKSLNKILPKLVKFIVLFVQGFLELNNEIYSSLKSIYSFLASKYSNLPNWLKIGIPLGSIAVPSFILVFSEKSRKKLGSFFLNLKDNLKIFMSSTYYAIKHNIDITKEIIASLFPYIVFSFDGVGYLFYSAYQLFNNIKLLNDRITM